MDGFKRGIEKIIDGMLLSIGAFLQYKFFVYIGVLEALSG